MSIEKRRSDRLMLTVPLRIHGTDPKGQTFREEGRTITLNRHGARIRIGRRLHAGQTVRLINAISHHEADFRVVGPVTPLTDAGGEYGVECLNSKENIWGIQFPPPASEKGADSKALLECLKCHTVSLLPVSLVEFDVLETAGILTRHCHSCNAESLWGYAETQLAMEAPPGEGAMLAEARAAAGGSNLRRYRRVSLQLPVLVRDYYGGVEITKSENVSKGGFCFASEKNHHVGEGVMVVCPYSTTGQDIEVHARIVRRQDLEGTNRKVYGIRYTPQIN